MKKMVACMRELAGAQTNYLDSVAKIAAQADVDIFPGEPVGPLCADSKAEEAESADETEADENPLCADSEAEEAESADETEADENQIGDGENAGNLNVLDLPRAWNRLVHNLLEVSLQQRYIFEQMERKFSPLWKLFARKNGNVIIVDRYSGHRIALEKANANLKGKARQWQRCCDKACSALSLRNKNQLVPASQTGKTAQDDP